MQDVNSPYLSVIVAIISDTTARHADVQALRGCLASLGRQENAPSMEIIVPYHAGVEGIDAIKAEWPDVQWVFVESVGRGAGDARTREHHDVLRARGLAAARGDVVAMIEDVGWPESGWASAVCAAHRSDFAAVGGAIDNGVERTLNWAVYFCDFGRYQNPLPEGETAQASDANVSFKRWDLEAVRDEWQEAFQEPAVNWALRSRGRRLALASRAVVRQHRDLQSLRAALRERTIWGRSFAVTRVRTMGLPARILRAALSPVLPFILLLRTGLTAWRRKRLFGRFLRSSPVILLLLGAWSYGELLGYVTGRTAGKTV